MTNALRPRDGYILTNGNVYSDQVFLSVLDSADNWAERELTSHICRIPNLYLPFVPGQAYHAGDKVLFEDMLYRCLMDHVAQQGWTPSAAPSLWTKILIPDADTIPEWEQPDSVNPYMTGDKVMHDGQVWTSTIDYNVWQPGIYGWEVMV